MPITLADIATDFTTFPDGAAVGLPTTATVKIAWDVKENEEYGPSQGAVVAIGQDELQIQLKGGKERDFAPLQKGDQVHVYTTPHKKTGAASGTKLRSYEKNGKTVRVLDVFGLSHLRILNREVTSQNPGAGPQLKQALAEGLGVNPGPAAPHRGGNGGFPAQLQMPGEARAQAPTQRAAPRPVGGKLTEAEWHQLYRRAFAALADFFDPRMPSQGNVSAFIEAAPVEILDIIHRGATSLCIAIQDGKVVADPETAPPPPPSARRDLPREVEFPTDFPPPFEDDDIPF